jgi:hypothetical protein
MMRKKLMSGINTLYFTATSQYFLYDATSLKKDEIWEGKWPTE